MERPVSSAWARTRGDRQALVDLPEGQLLEVFAYKPPTNKQERFVHWLFRIAVENLPEDGPQYTENALKNLCKVRFGWVDGQVVRKDRDPEWNFKSLTEMDEETMKEFIDYVVKFIETELVPGMDIEALKREAKERSSRRKW